MSIKEEVFEVLRNLSSQEDIKPEDQLSELYLDSLSLVALLVEIEDHFHIELDEYDMNPYELVEVQDVIDLVKKYCGDENE